MLLARCFLVVYKNFDLTNFILLFFWCGNNDSPPPPQHFCYFYPSPFPPAPPPHTPTTSGTMKLHKAVSLFLLAKWLITLHANPVTSKTRKSDTTRSQMPSVHTLTPHFNAPPQREVLIYHLNTITMSRVKARAAKDEEREEKIRLALEDRAQFNTSFEDLHHKYGIPKSTLCDRARGMQTRQKAHEDYQALTPAIEDVLKKWALRMDS